MPADHSQSGKRQPTMGAKRTRRTAATGTARTWALAVAGLAGVALVAAGCGGSSSPAVAHLSSGKGASSGGSEGNASSSGAAGSEGMPSQQQLVAFAKCMRSHGVSDFPEPSEGHLVLRGRPGPGLDRGSAQFETARDACRKLLPNGGRPSPQQQKQAEERALKFSACMRSHGEPNFPEPEFKGGGVQMRLRAGPGGIDPRSPQFQAAQKACQQYFGPPGSKGGPPPGPPGGGDGSKGGSEGSVATAP
jgi:hypothetical protein